MSCHNLYYKTTLETKSKVIKQVVDSIFYKVSKKQQWHDVVKKLSNRIDVYPSTTIKNVLHSFINDV